MNSDEKQAMFSREVQGTFMLTVEFKKIIVLGKFTKFITWTINTSIINSTNIFLLTVLQL